MPRSYNKTKAVEMVKEAKSRTQSNDSKVILDYLINQRMAEIIIRRNGQRTSRATAIAELERLGICDEYQVEDILKLLKEAG
jgi:DNA-binding protein